MPEIMVRFDDLRRYCEKRHCGSVPLEYIKQMPAIEAAPVRHGYWYIERKNVMSYGCTKCSNCHSAAALKGQAIAPNEYYCKSCGSKNSVNNELLFGEQGGADNG